MQSSLVHHRTFRLGELFCGAGGMALGASQAEHEGHRFKHIWAVDKDSDSCSTLRANGLLEPSNVVLGNVRDMEYSNFDPIDGLVFGFPCNDFSVVGEMRGIAGEYGDLYKYGIKALNALHPAFFVAENVSGLSSVNKNGDFQRILLELSLAGDGYTVVEHLYKFEKYGVPQNRHRYIIVGFRNDLGITFTHPPPSGKSKTARQALAGIPESAHNNELTNQSSIVVERLRHIQPGQNVFTANLPEELRLNMRSKATISQIYRRLLPDKPAYTVTASGGGGTHLYHWDEPRALTNRERARLQTFPDWYRFEGGKESVRKQVGMAVPPEGARVVFEAILKTLSSLI